MRIEICGAIGSGKSTLCMLLVNRGFNIVPENFNANPFWEAFYLNPGQYIFETEITFLLQHYHELKKVEKKNMMNITDYSFLQDLAYAKIGLNGKKLKIFSDIHAEIIKECDYPQGIICLKCDEDILLDRINKRGRQEEKKISKEFLQNLSKSIFKESEKIKTKTKVLYIDSGINNYVNDKEIQNKTLENIFKTFNLKDKF